MPKLHMRVSVELDITENQFRKIIDRSLSCSEGRKHLCDVDYEMLPRDVKAMIDIKKFDVCDWDEGGYIPDSWLGYDAEDSGLYEVDERGVRKKESATMLDAVYEQYLHDKNLPDDDEEE